MESFGGSGTLVIQAKVRLQTIALANQLLNIKDQYECLVKFLEMMESAKYTILEAVQVIQKLDFRKGTFSMNRYIKKIHVQGGP